MDLVKKKGTENHQPIKHGNGKISGLLVRLLKYTEVYAEEYVSLDCVRTLSTCSLGETICTLRHRLLSG